MLSRSLALSMLLMPAAAFAQSSPSAFTTGYRFDLGGREAGVILPSPGGGTTDFPATRSTYDANGNLVKVEKGQLAAWQDETILPANWSGFTVFQSTNIAFDTQGRKIRISVADSGGTEHQVTQVGYDQYNRVVCTALRMNPAEFASLLPADACQLNNPSAQNPDRITQTSYDTFNRVTSVTHALNTPLAQTYVSYTYSGNFALVDLDKPVTVTDGNGNTTTMTYGGSVFSKITKMSFPSPTTPGQSSTTDYEEYGYDTRGNRISSRKRDGRTIAYSYDALNRLTVKDISGACVSGYACTTPPTWAVRDVYYAYDLRGLQLSARFDSASGSDSVINAYDGFGRQTASTTSIGGMSRTVSYVWDPNGNKKRVIHPDGHYFVYGYDGLNRLSGASIDGTTVFFQLTYDGQGRPATAYRGSSSVTYGYDAISRLASHTLAPSGGTGTNVSTFSYNPASQLVSETRSNDTYAYTGSSNLAQAYVRNGLNQYASVGGVALGYDSNGSLSSNGGTSFTYDVENRLVKAAGTLNTELTYDPLGRLWQTTGASTTQFLYDGDDLIAEYDGAGTLLRRFAHGTGDDTPLLWVEGSAFTDVRTLLADARGSVVAVVQAGVPLAINAFDEYGVPKSGNLGRFQYTGQTYLPELGMYYYKARIYSSRLGRFLQTDPIGYEDQINLYAYVGNDPVNKRDPTGTSCVTNQTGGRLNVNCKVDDAQSFLKAGYTKAQIKELAQQNANVVAKLLRNPNAVQTIKIEGVSFKATGAELAKGLMNSYVTFNPKSTLIASMSGGATSTTIVDKVMAANPAGLPYVLRVGADFFSPGRSSADWRESLLHEALHTVPGEAAMLALGKFHFLSVHGDEYNRAAREFDGLQ